jgi:steroid delta-isomerase-like uncharacterized protein
MTGREQLEGYVHTLYEHWNSGNMDAFYEMIDEHVVDHNAGEHETGRAGVRTALDTLRAAFPDSEYKVLRVVADPEKRMTAAHLQMSGTQTGDLFGVPPSGKYASWKEIRFSVWSEEGRVVDHWAVLDNMNMFIQLGHVKWPGRADW